MEEKKSKKGLIIGLVITLLVLIAAVVVLLILSREKKNEISRNKQEDAFDEVYNYVKLHGDESWTQGERNMGFNEKTGEGAHFLYISINENNRDEIHVSWTEYANHSDKENFDHMYGISLDSDHTEIIIERSNVERYEVKQEQSNSNDKAKPTNEVNGELDLKKLDQVDKRAGHIYKQYIDADFVTVSKDLEGDDLKRYQVGISHTLREFKDALYNMNVDCKYEDFFGEIYE